MKTNFFILSFALVAGIGTLFADGTKIGDVYYNLDHVNHTAEVTYGENAYVGEIVVPQTFEYESNTYTVTGIGYQAFSNAGWNGLKKLSLPETIEYIEKEAFAFMGIGLKITIPKNVKRVGHNIFGWNRCDTIIYNAKTLKEFEQVWYDASCKVVIIGPDVDTIPAFFREIALEDVQFSENVKYVADYAFNREKLKTPIFNSKILVAIPKNYNTPYIIPEGTEIICGHAFEECTALPSVSIPNSVKRIGEYAFKDCSHITIPNLPASLQEIESYAFQNCSSLIPTTLPTSLQKIGDYAFQNCTSLTTITVPNSVKTFGRYIFDNCTNLTTATWDVSSGRCDWETSPFTNCSNLTSMTFGDNVDTIPNNFCKYFNQLSTVVFGNNITFIDDNAFNGCSALTEIKLPNSLKIIREDAFNGCIGLTAITLPVNLIELRSNVFSGCTNLTDVYVEAIEPPTLSWGVFSSNPIIYLACGVNNKAYQSSSWASYNLKYPQPNYTLTLSSNETEGKIQILRALTCNNDTVVIEATPNYGYHFEKWKDSDFENPRTIIMTQDSTITAEFAKNTYTITTQTNNDEWGTTGGSGFALYLDEVQISATANYGYHFVRWNDGNTSNPRMISVTEDKTYQAIFAKNIYNINKKTKTIEGIISGPSQAEYLDFVTLTAVPNYGYHFTQWSDGLKDNPRIAQITCDTTFTAEFAYDRVGTCGKDFALVWSYDSVKKVLTIGNAGAFTENMRFGVEAPNEMKELVIGNNVTAVGTNAFANIETLEKVSIGESVKTIGERAFYNCVNLETIYNYRATPTNAYSTTFDGVDKFECKLYVLANSIDLYKAAAVWRDFYYTYSIGAEEQSITTNDVTVEPSDNTATMTWPTNDNAATYTIQITKDGVVFCTLIFNANGQLTGIAFAPSRNGLRNTQAAIMTNNGMQFTITGLDSGTSYAFNLTAKDAQDAVIASYSGEFATTGVATAIDQINSEQPIINKVIKDGQLFILRGDKTYTLTGAEVK